MSSHDYGILSAPGGHHDHYPSAFMQGYNNQSYYSGDRYPSSHQHSYSSHLSSSQPQPFDRYLHVAAQHEYPRDPHLFERRIPDGPVASHHPHLRPSYGLPPPREQAPVATFSPPPASFEYGHATITHSTLPPAHRRDSLSSIASSVSNLVDFDPRPPHAGWTPKEEIDDEETKELLVNSKRDSMNTQSPLGGGSYLDRVSSTASPRDESLSPVGDSVRGGGGGNNSGSPPDSSSRKYSFVSLPGNAVRKRPRRRYDEIERLYACSWPDCPKAYGTLNHLNAHVTMQRHGPKRSPIEFKELRKQWREQKKQDPVVMPPATMHGHSHEMESESTFYFRRRRATEPNLSGPGGFSSSNQMLDSDDSATQINLQHRLSLQNISHFTDDTDTRHGGGASASPISATSDGVGYWQQHEMPLSPEEEQRHHHHHDMPSHDTLHYSVGSSPLISSSSPRLNTSLSHANRLPPDSTLLTPYSGYHRPPPASPPSPLSRTVKGGGDNNTLLHHPMSEGHRRSDIFEDRRP